MIDIPAIRKQWFLEQLEALKNKGMSNKDVAVKLDVLPQYISNIKNGNRGVSENFALKLCKVFDINHNDLLKRIRMYENEKHELQEVGEPEGKRRKIPLYEDVASIGGVNYRISDVDTPHAQVSEWIDAGDWFPDATSALRHYGHSMTEYPSGCILVLKRVLDTRLIIWGRNYSIETTEFRITKRLQDCGDGCIMAYSSNLETYPDEMLVHQPIRIPKDTIRHIDLVVGCVIKEDSNGVIPIIRYEK